MTAVETPPEPTRPSLDCAYEFVQPSYEVVLRRAEVAEARSRANLTFAGTFMFAAPAFVTAALGPGSRSFGSLWFVVGAAAFVGVLLCLIVQQVPKLVGEVQLISLSVIANDTYLEAPSPVFKLNLLLYAARAWDANWRHLNTLGNLATTGAVLFGLQVAALAIWVLRG